MEFKDRLKQLRIDKLGLSPGAIGNYENGTRVPKYETLQALAEFFHVNIDYLLYGDYLTRKQSKAFIDRIDEPLNWLSADDAAIIQVDQQAIRNAIRNNHRIRVERARELAKTLGTSIEDILSNPDLAEDGELGSEYYFDPETAKKAQELFENKDMRMLFEAAQGASPEDLQMAATLLAKLKKTNPELSENDGF